MAYTAEYNLVAAPTEMFALTMATLKPLLRDRVAAWAFFVFKAVVKPP